MSHSVLLVQPTLGDGHGTISSGLLSIATYLKNNGCDAKIIVVPVGTEIGGEIKKHDPTVVGISLHWFIHSDVLEVADKIKKKNPEVHILLGGFTASYFDRQILEYAGHGSIDGIIRGDGERPFLDYASTLDPAKVDNITYRLDEQMVRKPITYMQTDLKGFSCTSPDMNEVVEGWDRYVDMPIYKSGIYHVGIPKSIKLKPPVESRREFDVYVGKGCAYNCLYCGGCKDAHATISNRSMPIFRPTSEVIHDIRNLEANGMEKVCLNFGPFGDEKYYHDLLNRLGRTRLDVTFSPYRLPSRGLLTALLSSFQSCTVEFSPETGSERLRRRFWDMNLSKPYYSNGRLLQALRYIDALHGDIEPLVYFITGLPFETEKNFEATKTLAKEMATEFKDAFSEPQMQIICHPLFLEPASPIDARAEELNMIKLRTTFEDYVMHAETSRCDKATHPLGVEKIDLNEGGVLKRGEGFLAYMNDLGR